ncbi:MAG: hypothetical protein KDA68_04945 [Planctomycetaceae bacterium]|nr:hypothetical protein [Planctomycetaceae bacterium]
MLKVGAENILRSCFQLKPEGIFMKKSPLNLIVGGVFAVIGFYVGYSIFNPPRGADSTDKTLAQKVVEEVQVEGFEEEGEPTIRVMGDKSIQIMFNFMPPMFAEEANREAEFEKFDEVISKVVGVPVIWEDRELFIIQTPPDGTVEKIKNWLSNYHQKTN